MDNLIQDLRFAFRSLARRPGFTAVAVLTLALGVGATTAIFSVVHAVVLSPLPYPHPDRVVALWQHDVKEPGAGRALGGSVPHLNFLDWRRSSRTIPSMALYSGATAVLTGQEGGAEAVRAGKVTPGFFGVLGRPLALGREFTEEEDLPGGPDVAVVSYGMWQTRFGGSPDVLGRTVEVSGRPREIVGVAPEGLDVPTGAELWLPVQNDDETCGRGCVYLDGIGRLAPGATVGQAREEMHAIAAGLEAEYPEANRDMTAEVSTLREAIVGNLRTPLLILLLAVGMVLLIACANVANLLLARGASRAEEVAVRAALGAGRARLLAQVLTESLVLSLIGAGVGVLLASEGVDLLLGLAPEGLPRFGDVSLDGVSLMFALGMALLTALLFGLAPALHLARIPVTASIREGGRGSAVGDRSRSRAALLVAEVALSLTLLLGAGLLLRSFARLQSVEPGFTTSGVAQFRAALPGARYPDPDARVRFFEELRQRLASMPGIDAVGLVAAGLPLGPSENVTSFRRADQPPPESGRDPVAVIRAVDPGFFATLGVEASRGRTFEAADRHGATPVVVVNQALVDRQFGGRDAIGEQINVGVWLGYREEGPRTIVGVVPDMRTVRLANDPSPELWVPYAQSGASSASVVLRTSIPPERALRAARGELQAMDADVPMIRPSSMASMVDEQLAQPRFLFLLMALFAVLAVVLAAVGVYGVVAYVVAGRTREIGLRMALGADARSVLGLVLRQGMRPAALGVALGLFGGLAGARLLTGMLFQTRATDPATFVAVALFTLGVAAVACLVPARRATRIPPASALRSE